MTGRVRKLTAVERRLESRFQELWVEHITALSGLAASDSEIRPDALVVIRDLALQRAVASLRSESEPKAFAAWTNIAFSDVRTYARRQMNALRRQPDHSPDPLAWWPDGPPNSASIAQGDEAVLRAVARDEIRVHLTQHRGMWTAWLPKSISSDPRPTAPEALQNLVQQLAWISHLEADTISSRLLVRVVDSSRPKPRPKV